MDDLKYDMGHKNRGTCVIINNMEFDAEELLKREGSEVDAKNMKRLFKKLGFTVRVELNQTAQQIFKIAMDVGKKDHTDSDCFVMVILSHGKDYGEIWGKDATLKLEKIVSPIQDCKTLEGKPKLLFIQACRGSEIDDGVSLPKESDTIDGGCGSSHDSSMSIPLEAHDFLYAYSTPPGHYSFRNAKGGWFMQAIYKVFSDPRHANMELMQMMTRVNHKIAYDFSFDNCTLPNFHEKKQVSSVVSMLTKELYFTPKPEQPTSA